MAHRLITQVVVTGARVLGRSLSAAYKQAQASSQYARAQAAANPNGRNGRDASTLTGGLTLEEACKILNVKPPQKGRVDNMDDVLARYKKLFDANDPLKGGSFYLQSKVVRARERIQAAVRPIQEQAEMDAEIKAGWKPKIYKDR